MFISKILIKQFNGYKKRPLIIYSAIWPFLKVMKGKKNKIILDIFKVLIHFPPNKINKIFDEIHRVTSKWICGFEYFSTKFEEVVYRKNKNLLWKTDYTQLFLRRFKNLYLEKERFYRNISNNKEIDTMFLLKKK